MSCEELQKGLELLSCGRKCKELRELLAKQAHMTDMLQVGHIIAEVKYDYCGCLARFHNDFLGKIYENPSTYGLSTTSNESNPELLELVREVIPYRYY